MTMNNAQAFRAQVRATLTATKLATLADWRGRSAHLWATAHGEVVVVKGRDTAPGTPSNRPNRRDVNAARRAAKRLATVNRRLVTL